jgi:hypothetical protein
MRKRLLKAAADLQEGVLPYAAAHGDVYHVRPAEVVLPYDSKWDQDDRMKEAMRAKW